MNLIELFLLAVGLSMDAFAVSIYIGLTLARFSIKKSVVVGLYFGLFQAGMPLIGYFAANLFAARIIAYGNWIAFGLLCFLGGKMIFGSFRTEEHSKLDVALGPKQMLPLAVATSIDALAVGVSLAFLGAGIVPAVSLIGATTFTISIAGVWIGSVFGAKFKAKAEIAGGIILILIGFRILLEHLGFMRQ
jgi:putative Mn2+ efflux pump MntP